MKFLLVFLLIAFCTGFSGNAQTYHAKWESLKNYTAPEWYEDAKLGFWVHWGVYSVPAYMGDHAAEWYGRRMYSKDGQSRENRGYAHYRHHLKTYGDPSEFGYKDFIPMFKAENFDANQWAELFVEGGAKFFCMMAAHHDAFCLWDTKFSKWNSVKMGPKRDLVGEIAESVRNHGLYFGVSNHTAWNYEFFQWNHINKYDAVDTAYQDLYGNPIIHGRLDTLRWRPDKTSNGKDWWSENALKPVEPSKRDLDRWLARTKELADMYQPDLYYFDWGFNAPEFESRRKEFAAHYYNKGMEWGKGKFGSPGVVLNYKVNAFPKGAAVHDFERGGNDDIAEMVWQTDDCVYDGHNWSYVEDIPIKPVNRIVDELMEIISKRGVLMLSFAPKADGTFPMDQQKFIRELGGWLNVCGEAVYGTRPWLTAIENSMVEDGDFIKTCFTRTKNSQVLYATLLEMPQASVLISSINTKSINVEQIESVSMLGSSTKINWSIDEKGLRIDVSKAKPKQDFAYPIKIQFKK